MAGLVVLAAVIALGWKQAAQVVNPTADAIASPGDAADATSFALTSGPFGMRVVLTADGIGVDRPMRRLYACWHEVRAVELLPSPQLAVFHTPPGSPAEKRYFVDLTLSTPEQLDALALGLEEFISERLGRPGDFIDVRGGRS